VSFNIWLILFMYSVFSSATVIFPLSALVNIMLGCFLRNKLEHFSRLNNSESKLNFCEHNEI